MSVIAGLLIFLGAIGILAAPIMWVLGSKKAGVALRNGVILFILGGVIAAMSSSPSQPSQPTNPTQSTQPTKTTQPSQTSQPSQAKQAPEKRPDLELLEVSSTSDAFTRYAVGKIRNNTNRTYSYVQVEINLYDKNGNQVGSTLANVNNLEPGAVWSFKAPIFEEEAVRFKVADITGF